ncbi:MAG: ATP-binding cassette domain-containing protein [Gemmatimonadales bacterium]|nr:MAG: ATP-binding cassette domain-containing protein [Gemmatimonadales bacterium]
MEASAQHPAVRIENLVFSYRKREPVLDIEVLEVPAGERVFLHGASGSGKTTLLGLLTGVLSAEQGVVRVLGTDLTSLSGSRRDAFRGERLGYIFQMFNLIPYLTALDNIILPCQVSSSRRARVRGPLEDEARRIAARLEITSLLDSRPGELSVGQQQRVAAARALIGRPQLVVADEPTSALDSDRRDLFLDLLFDSCREAGATLLFVSHDRSLEDRFDRSLSLSDVNRALVKAT